jgi:hypothetical protein
MLKDGKFSCSTCTPPLEVAADGEFHPVAGRAYSDSASVKVDDDHNVTETMKKGDKITNETKYSVSDDGKTLTVDFKDSSGDKDVTGKLSETRVGTAPAGAHALSGSWKPAKYDNVSDEGTTVTYKLDGDTLHMSTPTGLSYDAKIGGPAVAVNGDIGKTMATVTKTGDNSYRETDTRNGKTVGTTEMTLDGDVMHVVSKNALDGSTTKYDMKRSYCRGPPRARSGWTVAADCAGAGIATQKGREHQGRHRRNDSGAVARPAATRARFRRRKSRLAPAGERHGGQPRRSARGLVRTGARCLRGGIGGGQPACRAA